MSHSSVSKLKKALRHRAWLGMAALLPSLLMAQEVDRKKYPDFTWKLNPNPSLLISKKTPEMQRTGTQRPTHVNNAELKFFPPVFNQDGGSCGSASRIRYMFTHEINAYRNLDGSDDNHNYPTHFVWLLTNGNSGKDEFVQHVGVPSAATYGGRTYSSLFGYQEETYEDFGWMTGYDKWYAAMHNRMLKPSHFPISVATEAGREAVKNWLWNHNGDESFHGGGICGIGVASGGDWQRIPQTAANDAAGVTGKFFVNKWGTSVDHALTIVGYDDRIEFDLNGNGVYGEKSADEVGAWIIVNSWSEWWCNSGFIYCPYAYGGAWFNENGTFGSNSWWYPEIYQVRKDYRPLRTIKLEMDYSRRSEIRLGAGISSDLNATEPEKTVYFEHFKFAGDGNGGNTNPAPEIPMLGKWADGKLHTEPMEFGYDLTDLSAQFDQNMPLKYFFIVETRDWGLGEGHVYNASIIDYDTDENGVETPFSLPEEGQAITSAGHKTVISTVVHGKGFYAPQNVCYDAGKLTWQAPVTSGHEVTSYRISREGIEVAEVDANVTSYEAGTESDQVTYAVTAVYGHEQTASQPATVKTPTSSVVATNTNLNLSHTGLTIPHVFQTKFDNATLEFWIKPSSLSNWNQAAGTWGSFMFHAGGDGSFTAGWDTGGHRVDGHAGDLVVNEWKHVAMVVEGNVFTVYINGKQSGSVTSDTYSGLGGFGDLVFSSNAGSSWNAYVDEIRIWNYARTADQIKNSLHTLYAGSKLPTGLIAYYRGSTFKQDDVTYLRDYAGHAHAPVADGSKASTPITLHPKMALPTEPLTASVNQPTGTVYAGIPVTLTATCSESATRTAWTIPAAGLQALSLNSPSVTFQTAGEAEVTLTAYDGAGHSVNASAKVNVLTAPLADATFKCTRSEVPVGDRITFMAQTPMLGYTYEWSMPGAEVEKATTANASASYREAGTYKVTLKVTTPGGESTTSEQSVKVIAVAPVANFEIPATIVKRGEEISLKDASRYAPHKWEWTLHSEAKDYALTGEEPTLVPDMPGVYDVTLVAHNATGSDTVTRARALTVCNADSRGGLNFSGAAAVTTHAHLLTAGAATFTVDWWMNPSVNTTYSNGLGDTESTLLLKTNADGALMVCLSGKSCVSTDHFIQPGEWHHYAVAYNKGKTYFYRDGVQICMKAQNTTSVKADVARFVIGGADTPLNGRIDELRFWNTFMNADALKEYANAPVYEVQEASAKGLLLYYDFNQSGGDVIDRTENGFTGVRTGFGPDGDAWGLSLGVFSLGYIVEAPTAIDFVQPDEPLTSGKPLDIYDLSGRRVSRPSHGVYIVGGKKICVK